MQSNLNPLENIDSQCLSSPISLHITHLSELVDEKNPSYPLLSTQSLDNPKYDITIQTLLKEFYLRKKFLPKFIDEDDPDIPELTIQDSYINLAIVKREEQKDKEQRLRDEPKEDRSDDTLLHDYEDIHTPKEPITIEQMFDRLRDGKESRKILIYGRAGIGKTTLIHKIAYLWAQNSLWRNKFDYVFWLPLRKLSKWERSAIGDIECLIKAICDCCLPRDNNTKSLRQILDLTHNTKTLFLLDGYDEIVFRDNEDSVVKDLINIVLEKTSNYVIMTSRPNAVDTSWQAKFDQHLENIGLSQDNITRYIDTYFNMVGQKKSVNPTNLTDSLYKFIERRNIIQVMTRIPINLFLLCFSWESLMHKIIKNKDNITLTYLYTEVVNLLMKRYLNKTHQKKTINRSTRAIVKECNREYKFLGLIAFVAMKKDKIVIESHVIDDLRDQSDIDGDLFEHIITKTGLVKAIGDDSTKIIDKDHYFVHMTFQEYFAAWYLVQLLEGNESQSQEALFFIEQHRYSRIYERVISFVTGILNKKSEASRTKFWNIILNGIVDLNLVRQAVLIARCLEENEDSNLPYYTRLLEYITEIFKTYFTLDRTTLDQIIAHYILCPRIVGLTGLHQFLINKLQDRENEDSLRNRAAAVLGKLGQLSSEQTKMLIKTLQDDRDFWIENGATVLIDLGLSSPEVIRALILDLQDENDDIRDNAITATFSLQSSSPDLTQALTKNLNHENHWTRITTVKMLGYLKPCSPEIVEALITVLQEDTDPIVRSNAVTAIINLQSSLNRAIPVLIATLQKDHPWVRICAAKALGELRQPSPDVIEALIISFQDEDPKIRESVVHPLVQLGSLSLSEVIEPLVRALQSDRPWIKKGAAEVLGNLRQPSCKIISLLTTASQDSNDEVRSSAVKALRQLTPLSLEVISPLITALQHTDNTIRRKAAQESGYLGQSSPMINQALVTALHDTDSVVRSNTVKSLGQLRPSSQEVITSLISALRDNDENVRRNATQALGKVGSSSSEVIQALITSLQNTSAERDVRVNVIRALGQLGSSTEVVQALIQILSNSDNIVRSEAENALRTVVNNYPKLLDSLLTGLNDLKCNHQLDMTQVNRLTHGLPTIGLFQCLLQYYREPIFELVTYVANKNNMAVTTTTDLIRLHNNMPVELRITDDEAKPHKIKAIFDIFYKHAKDKNLPTLFLDAIIDRTQPFPIKGAKSMSNTTFTAVVLCAKYEEAYAFRQVLKHQRATEDERSQGSLLYHLLTIKDLNNRTFEIQIYCPRNQAGSVITATDVISILNRLSPHWVFMTGICAGNPKETVLGDVIIAEKIVDVRYGKIDHAGIHHDIRPLTIDAYLSTAIYETKNALRGAWSKYIVTPRPMTRRYQEQAIRKLLHGNYPGYTFLPDIMLGIPGTFESKEECGVVLSGLTSADPSGITRCIDGKYALNSLQYEELTILIRDTTFPKLDTKEPEVYSGTLLTDVSAVRADIDEKRWTQYGEKIGARDLYGLEMEGIGLYEAIETINRDRNPKIKFMLVKGVSDYAGEKKDDQFHEYGKQASAVFVYEFLRRYGYKLIYGDKDDTSTDLKKN